MSTTTGLNTGQKENNKNLGNTKTCKDTFRKKFVGGNASLAGRVFNISSKDAVRQFSETEKTITDYVGQENTHGGDIRYMIENLEDYNFIRPDNPEDEDDQFEIES
jgi:hypothetical protein